MHCCVPRLLPTIIILLDTVSGPRRGQIYLQPLPILHRQRGGQRRNRRYNPDGSHPSGLETPDANGTEGPGVQYLPIGRIRVRREHRLHLFHDPPQQISRHYLDYGRRVHLVQRGTVYRHCLRLFSNLTASSQIRSQAYSRILSGSRQIWREFVS